MAAGYDGSIRIDTNVNTKGFNSGVNSIGKGLTGITSSLKKLAVAAGIAFGVAAIVNFGKASVKASTELSNAMTGLKSIMDGQGRSFSNAQKFINSYVEDGLIPATEAITSYKNLALRGYDDSQIQQVMIALKDSAAFGRQSSYTLGQAVASATEGLKNENSILVDNAGVTKNVAKMWDEYAKAIGTTANNLTHQQKIQAEVTGILEETKFQTGDAAKVANSYSGEVLKLGFNFNNLKIAIGNALIPIAQAVLPSISAIIAALTRLANVFAQVTTAIFGKQAKQQEQIAKSGTNAAKAQSNLASATKKAGKEAEVAVAGFDELNVLAKETASSADGATGGLGEDIAVGEIATGGEIGSGVTVSPAVQTAVDVLMKMLEPLKSINFDNLNNAFDRLKKAVEPITKAIFGGLEWAYLNLLVPLSKWVIEEALPVWLDAFSSQLDFLNSVIEVLKPLGIWLWDVFLKPFLSWAGDRYIDWLKLLSKGFTAISDWIKEHKTLIQDIVLVIGSFATAWGLVNIAIGIWNTIGVIATAVTTAFGAAVAFLTSPIGIVIIAIGAIIAIIVLLIRHWDEVKEAASKCWDWIKEKWSAAGEWFNKTVVEPVKTLFSGLWDNIKLKASEAWEGVKTIWQIVSTWFNTTVIIPITTFFTNLKNSITTLFSDAWTGIKNVWSKASNWFKSNVVDPIGKAFKTGVNFWIGLAEGFANGFIKGINGIINALNKINFDIPDWVPGIGGNSFGIDIPNVKNISIPKLATGAVIPPNSEFMAILGDQKSGRNIETPESLLRQIVREELGGMMQGGDITIENIMNLDGDVVYRDVKKIAWEQFKRTGESPFPA